jgi:hypothetical protein
MKVPATDFDINLSQLSGHEGRGWQQPGIRGFFILWKGFDEHLEAGPGWPGWLFCGRRNRFQDCLPRSSTGQFPLR